MGERAKANSIGFEKFDRICREKFGLTVFVAIVCGVLLLPEPLLAAKPETAENASAKPLSSGRIPSSKGNFSSGANLPSSENSSSIQSFTATPDLRPDVMAIMWKGIANLNRGKPKEAVKFLEQASRMQPDKAGVWSIYSLVLTTAGNSPVEGEKAARKGLSFDRNDGHCLASLVLALSFKGDFQNAEAAFRKAISLGKVRSATLYSQLGYCCLQNKNFAEAEKAYMKAVELEPKDAGNWRELAELQQDRGAGAAAIKSFENAVRLDPGDKNSWYNLGNLLVEANPTRGKQCFERALSFEQDSYNEYGLAYALFKLKKYSDAERHCRASLKLESNDINTWKLLLRILVARKQKTAIRETIDALIKTKPNQFSLMEVVRLLAEGGDLEDVRYIVSKAVPSQRTPPEKALVVRGMILDAAGQESEAIEYFEKAIKTKPTMTAARFQLALVRFRRGEIADAIRQMRLITHLNPDNQNYALNLSIMLLHTGDTTEAEALARRCLARDPNSPVCMAQLGRILAKQKKTKEAEKYLRSATVCNSNDFATLCSLAATEHSLGNLAHSELLYERAAEIQDDPRIWTELGIVQLNQGKKEGIVWLKKATSTAGGARAWRALSYALKNEGDEKGAEEALKKSASSNNTVDLRDGNYLALERMSYRNSAVRKKRNPDTGILLPSFMRAQKKG